MAEQRFGSAGCAERSGTFVRSFQTMAAATAVHDTSEAVKLCGSCGLFLKPITKMLISVALPQLKQTGKSISNWEVMERLKGMVNNHHFSTLRISKSTMDFIRFEGEVENKSLVKTFLAALDGKSIKLSGFSDILKVRAAEYKLDFPTRHNWDSFFRDAKNMNESLPGERPDTIHLEGLPCKWFALKDSGSEKPNEEVLIKVFSLFGEIRMVDVPMLDAYREEMAGRSFHTFSFGGHLNFEAYVQYKEYVGFVKAMNALRGMKLMYKDEDGKAVACNIKVSFDSTKHLSEASIKKRQLEQQKLQELERRREEQNRKEKEAEERQKEEERKQKELEEVEKERKRIEKIRRTEEKQKRKNKKKLQKIQAEEQKKLQGKIRFEERRLLLAQRNLQSIRIIAELLSRVKATKLHEQEEMEAERFRLFQLEEQRKEQEAELRRVEEEKQRAQGLQCKERELREKLVKSFFNRSMCSDGEIQDKCNPLFCFPLKPSGNIHHEAHKYVTSTSTQTPSANEPLKLHSLIKNGVCCEVSALQEYKQANVLPEKALHIMSLHSINGNSTQPNPSADVEKSSMKESDAEQKEQQKRGINCQTEDKVSKSKHKRHVSSDPHKKVKKSTKTHFTGDRSPRRKSSSSPTFSKHKSKPLKDRLDHKRKRHHRRSYSRERESWRS
ncbi:A-kinase anchor protein 17A [Xenopus laevis]|uniref:A-kinase anchor protein 17A n=1 Tax=Xenopus laevis TaxID=8355 RepID=A0A8J0UJ06_XENLA|nr:A-kinase anchor protein 17A [Xenopus laevis]